MRRIFLFISVPLLVLVFGFVHSEPEEEKINWISLDEAVALSSKDGKKILIDMYTDWCGWCKKMDRQTFSNPKVVELVNEHFYAVKFNAEQREDVVLKGRTYRYRPMGRRGVHELALRFTNNRPSYPSFAVLDSNAFKLTTISGYKKPKEFYPILGYFAEDAFQKEGFTKFHQRFMSENWK